MLSVRQKALEGVSSLGQFLMKGRREAAIAAMLTAAIPFLGWASLVIVCLVTLRKGIREGLFVMGWALVPAIISSWVMGSGLLALENVISYVWLLGLAALLRKTASWRYVLEMSAVVAVVGIIFLHIQIPDLGKIYFNYLMALYKSNASSSVGYTDMQNFIRHLVNYLLGIQVMFYMIHNLFCLVIARGIQAVSYNPNGLSNELKTIRLGAASWVFAAFFLFFGIKMSSSWALDTFPVWAALFFFAGLSLVHYLIKARFNFRWVTPVFYILLILLFPASIVPLIVLAFIDTGWNIRKNFKEVDS